MNDDSGLISGWWVFAGVLLLVAGVLNIIYGIAAIGDSKFFTENATYILSGLHTWGWILLILGVLELVAAFSLFSGGRIRPLVRDLHRLAERDGRPALDPRATRSGRWRSSPSRSSSSTSWPRARKGHPAPSQGPATCCGRRPRESGAFVVSEAASASPSR